MSMSTIYPDTAEGAIECLKAESTIADGKYEVATYKAFMDPAVEGVWKLYVQMKCGERWVVVLEMAGYKDPWGKIRETTDWDSLDPEDDWRL